MKKIYILTLALWISAFTLTIFAFRTGEKVNPVSGKILGTYTLPTSENTKIPQPAHSTTAATDSSNTGPHNTDPPPEHKIKILVDGALTEYGLEDAVASIVAAEMPALFPEHALRAQAVAARTYVLYKEGIKSAAHPSAVICDNPSCCCALADLDTLAGSWGENAAEYAMRITDAVADTCGIILTYDSKPALTVFHSMSGRKTNSSLDIWGTHVPYLISVDAPKGESELKGYTDNVIVSKSEFKSAFLARHPEAVLSDSSNTWFKNFVRAPSGTVLSVEVGGVTVDGMSIRFLCGLRSADFTVTQGTDRLLFETRGYGHGVGMSQNGAKVLALDGYPYQYILAFYYPGTKLAAIH